MRLKTSAISLMEFRDLCYKTTCKYSILKVLFGSLKEKGLLSEDTEDCFLVSSFFSQLSLSWIIDLNPINLILCIIFSGRAEDEG